MSDTPRVQTALTSVEGLAFAPWLKTVLLFGAVPVLLARCWCEVARYVMHPDSKALAGVLLMPCTHGAPAGDRGDRPAAGHLSGDLPVAGRADPGRAFLAGGHPTGIGPYLTLVETEPIDAVVVETFEVVEVDE